jgi:hypothetical protein
MQAVFRSWGQSSGWSTWAVVSTGQGGARLANWCRGLLILCAAVWLSGCADAVRASDPDTQPADALTDFGTDAATPTDTASNDTASNDTASTDTMADVVATGTDASPTCGSPCVDTDNNPCSYQACEAGVCVSKLAADGSACEDGNPCTATATCQAGTCKPDSAPGNNLCPCQTNADCTSLDDGLLCNGQFFCDQSSFPPTCKVNPASIPPCGTQLPPSPCLVASCKEPAALGGKASCAWTPQADGTPCSDNNAQTEGDTCLSGVCVPGEFVGTCQTAADCAKYEDGNACNGKLFCNKAKGQCQVNPSSVVSCPTANDTLCRRNQCQPVTGECVLTPRADKEACDDGNPCTAGEVCVTGTCGSATNICTCDSDTDCAGKDDGNLCNGTLYCNLQTGTCALNPATVVTCAASNNPCTQLACQPQSGACVDQPVPNGTPCNADNSLCTLADTCNAGNCTAGENLCKCATSADCAVYDDGDLCNGQLFCNQQNGTCGLNPATVVSCVDSLPGDCSAVTCEPTTGACVTSAVAAGAPCEDGVACTLNQACDGSGQCSGGFSGCGCAADWDCASVDDGNACNGKVVCDLNALPFPTCATQAPAPCAPTSPCELAACDPKTGACNLSAAPTGATCDDGDGCTKADECVADGSCAGVAIACDDGKPCTTDLCAGGGCVYVKQPDGTACNDGNPCTLADACTAAACAGIPLGCDDGNTCTVDVCDPSASGCIYTPLAGPCDDGDVCTFDDMCSSELCLGKPVVCDDGDPCTFDEVCTPEGCVAQGKLTCSDAEACTTDLPCEAGVGCPKPLPDNGAFVYWSQSKLMESFGSELLAAGPADPVKGTTQWAAVGFGQGADPYVRLWGLPGEQSYGVELGFPGSTHAFAVAWDGEAWLIGGQNGYGSSYPEQTAKPLLARVTAAGQILWIDNQFRPGVVLRGLAARPNSPGRVMAAGTVDAGVNEANAKLWLAELDVSGPAPTVVREATCVSPKGGALAAGLNPLSGGQWAVSGRVKNAFATAGQPTRMPIVCLFDDAFEAPPKVLLPEVAGVEAQSLLERTTGGFVLTLVPNAFDNWGGPGAQVGAWSALLLSSEGTLLSTTPLGVGGVVVGLDGDLLAYRRDVQGIAHVFGVPLGVKDAAPSVLWAAQQATEGRAVVRDSRGYAILTEDPAAPLSQQQTETLTHVDGRWATTCGISQLCATNCDTADQCSLIRCKELGCAADPFVCDDGNPCTLDLCGQSGCVQKIDVGAACDDGRLCTIGDVCKDGQCVGQSRLGTNSQIVDVTERIRGAVAHGDGLLVVGERLQGAEAQVFWRKYNSAGIAEATGIVRTEPISSTVPQVLALAKFGLTYSVGGGFPAKFAPAVVVRSGDGFTWLYTIDPNKGTVTPVTTLDQQQVDRDYGLVQYLDGQVYVLQSDTQGLLRIHSVNGLNQPTPLVSWDLGVYQPRALLPVKAGFAVVSEDKSSGAGMRVDLINLQGEQLQFPAFAAVDAPPASGQPLIKGVYVQDQYVLTAIGESKLAVYPLAPDPLAEQYSVTVLTDALGYAELPGAIRTSRKGGGAIARQSEEGWGIELFDGFGNLTSSSYFSVDAVVGLALTEQDVWVVTEEAGGSKRDVRVVHLDFYGYSSCGTGLVQDCFGLTCEDNVVCTANACLAGTCQYNSLQGIGQCGTAGVCGAEQCPVPFSCQQCSPEATCDTVAQTCTCNAGFMGDGQVCTDINECTVAITCTPPAVCTNTYGGFTCN